MKCERTTAVEEYNKEVDNLEAQMEAFSGNVEKLNKIDFALKKMQSEDPELYEDIKGYLDESETNFNNPYVQGLETKLDELTKIVNANQNQINSKSNESQNAIELNGLKAELKPLLDATKLSPDWDKVNELKANSNGTLTAKPAFNALYADKISSLKDSKHKVNSTKRTVKGKGKLNTVGQGKGKSDGSKKSVDYSAMNNDQAFDSIAKGILG